MVVYTIVVQRTEQRQYQTRTCHSLHCLTAACDCAVLDGVMWYSPCTQGLTAAGSPLNFLKFPPLLNTTYHNAVPSCDIHRAHSSSLQQAHLSIFSTFHHCSTPSITVQYRHVTFTVHTVAHCLGSPLNFLNSPPPLHTTYHSAVPSCDIHRAHSGSLQQAHLSIFSPFHHCSTPPITVLYPSTAITLSYPQLAPSPLTGNSLTLYATWRHRSADSLDCSNCYQSKCDGHCGFWG